jgi:hypothetical protein
VIYYVKSVANLAGSPASFSWTASQFGTVQNTLDGLSITSQFTYPQFLITPDNKLQLVYRSAVSGNGVVQVAEYSGTWTNLGGFTSATGTYTGPNGASKLGGDLASRRPNNDRI